MVKIKLFFFLLTFIFGIDVHSQYSGTVFLDGDGNGYFDRQENGIANVLVSDGLHVSRTDKNGRFTLQGWEDMRFVHISTPAGYQCQKFYHNEQGIKYSYDFALTPDTTDRNNFSFIHITDTETSNNKSKWIEILKTYIHYEKPAFLIHTGDICYKEGMNFHAQHVNSSTMGIPTYYCIGNHDLVAGKYGEELYESLFGPSWYSFEVGNSVFIVTPMLHGDFKPSYTKKDVYFWLKNLLTHFDKEKPKFVFNHDLLTGEDAFIYGIDDEEYINLNDHNLKAWVYGHWHNSFYRPHGNSGVVSICTGVAQRGGIDHSLSQFRVFNLNIDGSFTTELVQTYVDHQLVIVSPAPITVVDQNKLPILVNAYNSTSRTREVSYTLNNKTWHSLQQQTNWTWIGKETISENQLRLDSLYIVVKGEFNDGQTRVKKRQFVIRDQGLSNQVDASWPNFLLNGQHHPGHIEGPQTPLLLEWVTNTGANIYMCSPVVAEGKVFIASYDNGDARNCYIFGYDYQNGRQLWRFRTDNSIKGSIAYEAGSVFATDMLGNVYAVDAKTGMLRWKIKLEMKVLPGYVGGTIADRGFVYTGDGKGFCAINQKDGVKVWCNTEWNSGVGGPPSPTIGDDLIVASSNWNALYCHDIHTGKLLWKKRELGLRMRDAAPVFYLDTLFVGTQNNILAIQARSGEMLKQKETDFRFKTNSTPLIYDNLMVLGTVADGIVAFNRNNFEVVWKYKTGPALSTSSPYSEPIQCTVESSPVLVNGKEILVGASDGFFYCLDAKSGSLNWRMELGAPIFSTVAVTQDRIFLADIAGNLYSFIQQ